MIESIYLGDRGVTKIEIDNEASELRVHVDVLSRIRSPTGQWDFYADEDIERAVIVFEGVSHLAMNSSGGMPDDFIHELAFVERAGLDSVARLVVGCTARPGSTPGPHEACFVVTFRAVHLLDPRQPGIKIRH